MLPDLARFLAGFELVAKRQGFAPSCNEAALRDALDEAGVLAHENDRDEPAALFYALARRPRAFGKVHGRMTVFFTIERARALGLEFQDDLAVLEVVRLRVVLGAIEFSELREWFSEHFAPIRRKPWPPG